MKNFTVPFRLWVGLMLLPFLGYSQAKFGEVQVIQLDTLASDVSSFTYIDTYTDQLVDIDGDGDADLVKLIGYLRASDTVQVYELVWAENIDGFSTGSECNPLTTPLHVIDTFEDVTFTKTGPFVADLDDDGDFDVLHIQANGDLVWYSNNGSGAFSSSFSIAQVGLKPYYLKFGDLNSDSHLDIVVVTGKDGVYWVPNLGSGQFGSLTQITSQIILSNEDIITEIVQIADFNQDTYLDILVPSPYDTSAVWYPNTGTGTFQSPVSVYSHLGSIDDNITTHVMDVDQDGDIDIITSEFTRYQGVADTMYVYFLENTDGAGTFGSPVQLPYPSDYVGAYGRFFDVDIDEDGDLDLVGGGATNYGLVYFENIGGSAVFDTVKTLIPSDTYNYSAFPLMGDISGDGQDDFYFYKPPLSFLQAAWYQACTPSYTNELVGHWAFDNCQDTVLVNLVGTQQGELVNGASFDLGYANQGLEFSSSTEQANLHDSTWTLGNNDAVSYSFWVYPQSANGNRETMLSRNTNGTSLILALTNLRPIYFLGGTNGAAWTFAGNALTQNAWNHLVFTYANGTLTLYQDGVQTYQQTGITGNLNFGEGHHTLGLRYDDQKPFLGRLDEVRFFNTELTSTDAAEEYSRVAFAPAECTYTPVAYYAGDDCNADTAFDGVGAQDGLLVGASKGTGYLGTGFSLDGNDHINLGQGASLDFTDAFSVAYWVKTTMTGNGVVLTDNYDGSNFSYTVFVQNGLARLGLGNGIPVASNYGIPTAVNDGAWHHVAWTYGEGTVRGYLDGQLEVTVNNIPGAILPNTTTDT
ncbi:MAG TPA: hypothetical protein DCR93_34595, partial [Cytophagales bacterium]|nr:hypothetical protein [Cytophagales bacterium]